MSTLLLKNLNIIDPFGKIKYLPDAEILVQGGIIASVAQKHEQLPDSCDVLDMKGKYVLPGMINTHLHLYSTLALGMPSPSVGPENFVEKLEYVWWVLDRALDSESTRASFEVGLLECLKSGVTTVFDHHSSQSWISGSMDLLVETADIFGINISPCFETTDRNGKAVFNEALEENLRTIKKYRESPFVAPLLGLHASFTLEDDSLKKIAKYTEKDKLAGIHIHLSEDKADEVEARIWGYDSVVRRLDHYNLLNKNGIVAHGIHIQNGDLKILREKGISLVHNPTSNANNRVGVLPDATINTMNAGLGTDGMQTNMLREAKEGTLIRSSSSEMGQSTADYLKMLFQNNPLIASNKFRRKIGHIYEGFAADLAFYDYNPRTKISTSNAASHVLFAFEKPIDVMTRGVFRIREFEYLGLNEEEIYKNAEVQSQKLWKKMSDL